MNREIIDILLAATVILAAAAVAAVCALGLIVWLAGGKMERRKD